MKAFREIGIEKLIKYIFFSFWEVIFKFLLFSPLRIFWMRLFGAKIGKDTIVGNIRLMNLYRTGLKGLAFGNKCFVGDYVNLDLADKIILEDDCTLSEEVLILTHTNVGYEDHPLQKAIPCFSSRVVISKGCFIGVRATILPGVVIGKESAIGACSLVNHDISPYELHAGVPAKLIRKLK